MFREGYNGSAKAKGSANAKGSLFRLGPYPFSDRAHRGEFERATPPRELQGVLGAKPPNSKSWAHAVEPPNAGHQGRAAKPQPLTAAEAPNAGRTAAEPPSAGRQQRRSRMSRQMPAANRGGAAKRRPARCLRQGVRVPRPILPQIEPILILIQVGPININSDWAHININIVKKC